MREPRGRVVKTSMLRKCERVEVGISAGPLFPAVFVKVARQRFHAADQHFQIVLAGRFLRGGVCFPEPFECGAGLLGRLQPHLLRQREHQRHQALDFAGRELFLGESQEERHLFLARQPAEVIGRSGEELAELDKRQNVRREASQQRQPLRDPALRAAERLRDGRERQPFPLVKIADQ